MKTGTLFYGRNKDIVYKMVDFDVSEDYCKTETYATNGKLEEKPILVLVKKSFIEGELTFDEIIRLGGEVAIEKNYMVSPVDRIVELEKELTEVRNNLRVANQHYDVLALGCESLLSALKVLWNYRCLEDLVGITGPNSFREFNYFDLSNEEAKELSNAAKFLDNLFSEGK